MSTREQSRVGREQLSARCDPASLPFETTDELAALEPIFGQERAIRAIEFALNMDRPGYHLYAAGPDGIGKRSTVEHFLHWRALLVPAPPDWVYVHNFADPDRPVGIQLPPGEGREFAEATAAAVERAIRELRQAFESDSYARERVSIEQRFQRQRTDLVEQLIEAARAHGFQAQMTAGGFTSAPLVDGRPLSEEEVFALPAEERDQVQQREQEVQQLVQEAMLELRRIEARQRAAVEQLDEGVVAFAIEPFIRPLVERYSGQPAIADFLAALQADVRRERDHLRAQAPLHRRYQVNVAVAHERGGSAPVIFERHPSHQNLIGRIEYAGQPGALVSDHMMIRAGSLAAASGGYLVLRLRDLLADPNAYTALKRALAARELVIENFAEAHGMLPVTGLRPQPMPLQLKVVIVGDSAHYGLLYRLDPDFRELFRVKADFDVDFERTDVNIQGLAAVIRQQSDQHGLLRFARGAVARLVEHSSRLVEDQRRLSADMSRFIDLVHQSEFWARQDGADLVDLRHVERALDEAEYRSSLVRDRVQRLIDEGSILIDVAGTQVGQVNALSVYDLGDMTFGRPTRITCIVAAGQGSIVNVERETNMAGRTHNKGFLIARGVVAQRFGQRQAMAMQASLTFEQLYGEIDGDSASSTEIYALLSALADAAIDQGIAVTGSVNQRGEIQPIGGATAKIEGFYEVCRAKGLTGSQGVIVPRANLHNVALRPEVAQAIEDGRFHVWAIDTIEQGIEILTGTPAGERQTDGRYPEGTVYQRVEQRLDEFSRIPTEQRTGRPEVPAAAAPAPTPSPPPPPGIPPPPPEPPISV